ncbi:hypothetical protein GGI22_000549 [Coemansia erecta]|nr:hypothetical protein GGI22_000549 [Coemansia erecta]
MLFKRILACTKKPKLVVRFLRWSWFLFVIVNEVGLYLWQIGLCQWPTNGAVTSASHVAIVTDPQIVDHYSFDQTGLLLRATQFLTDTYVRKSYLLLQSIRQPPTVIFLGDLMDGGREWDDTAWLAEYSRYQSIFRNRDPENRRVYDMAGNHDIGIGNTIVSQALSRFHRYVGPTNQVINVGGHSIVLLDTLTLESDDPSVSDGSRKLVQWLEDERAGVANSTLPRLLFTHVPMWRPENTFCGPLRQSKLKYLQDRRGYQFRDQLFQNTTEYLLKAIQPAAVFSGDDHDTCTIQHQIAGPQTIPEYTIGAFGWTSGVPIASYGLLSLHHSGNGNKSFILQNFDVWRGKVQRLVLDVLLGTRNIACVAVPTYVLCNILFYII